MTLPVSGSITIVIPVALYILPFSGSITIIIPVVLSIIIIVLFSGSIIISLPVSEFIIMPVSGSIIIPVLLSICCASTLCEKGYVVRKSGVRRMDEMIIADIIVLAIHCFFLIKAKVFIEIYYFLRVLFYYYVQFFT